MDELFGIVATSMSGDLARLNAVSHNLSNVSTTGFKRVLPTGVSFEQTLQHSDGEQRSMSTLMVDSRQGALSRTGSHFDLAIEGNAYFELAASNGETLLSRGGAFELDSRGRLVATQSGLPLLGDGGEIFLQAGAFQIEGDGKVTQNNQTIARVKLAFPSQGSRIEPLGEGLYQLSYGSLDQDGKARLRQGFQEASNVNSATEMVTLIETTRHFESMQKIVHGVDTMWEKTLRTLGEF